MYDLKHRALEMNFPFGMRFILPRSCTSIVIRYVARAIK